MTETVSAPQMYGVECSKADLELALAALDGLWSSGKVTNPRLGNAVEILKQKFIDAGKNGTESSAENAPSTGVTTTG